jgi:hypothetical protein
MGAAARTATERALARQLATANALLASALHEMLLELRGFMEAICLHEDRDGEHVPIVSSISDDEIGACRQLIQVIVAIDDHFGIPMVPREDWIAEVLARFRAMEGGAS